MLSTNGKICLGLRFRFRTGEEFESHALGIWENLVTFEEPPMQQHVDILFRLLSQLTLLFQMADPTSNKSVSQGCMRRMRRESKYGEENMKPVPVVQILRWQGASKEWVVIDLVPETSEPSQSADKRSPSKKSYQEKTKNGSKKSEDISGEPSQ